MKKKLVILGALAITAAAAVPALALENEFHGMYRLRGMMTNFQSAGLGSVLLPIQGTGVPAATSDNALVGNKSRSFTLFEQRARIQYIAKANDNLKLVTHFEIDSTWGDAAYQNGRGMGGGLAADTVNLETKNVYLDFNLPSSPVNMKLGIQGFADAYKGIILFDDVAGAVATAKAGPATITGAFLRTLEGGGTTALGKKNIDVYALDAKVAASKAVTVGASYYLFNNDMVWSGQKTHNFGINAAAKAGIVDFDAFFLYQGGHELASTSAVANRAKDLSAYAAQVALKANLGKVAVRAAGLWATGDDGSDPNKSNAYQTIMDAFAPGTLHPSVAAGSYYSSNMLLLMRSIIAMDSDNSLVPSINNGNRGLQAAFLGVDANLSDKFSVNVNIGHALIDKKMAATPTENKTIGTEFNTSLNYKLYPNLTATAQGAYVVLGGYTKGIAVNAAQVKDLKAPYLAGLMMNYAF